MESVGISVLPCATALIYWAEGCSWNPPRSRPSSAPSPTMEPQTSPFSAASEMGPGLPNPTPHTDPTEPLSLCPPEGRGSFGTPWQLPPWLGQQGSRAPPATPKPTAKPPPTKQDLTQQPDPSTYTSWGPLSGCLPDPQLDSPPETIVSGQMASPGHSPSLDTPKLLPLLPTCTPFLCGL